MSAIIIYLSVNLIEVEYLYNNEGRGGGGLCVLDHSGSEPFK